MAFIADLRLLSRDRAADPRDIPLHFAHMLAYIHYALPDPPVSAAACLSALPSPTAAAAASTVSAASPTRSSATSSRTSPRAAPLALTDSHLLPGGGDGIPVSLHRANSRAVATAVSRILAAHPGPFRTVHLACCLMDEHHDSLAHWLQHLAVKGVRELVLINRPWPPILLDKHVPAAFFGMAALARLYLGFFRFPDTAALPRGAAFPCLCELALCSVTIDARDIEFVLDRSPVLEILCFEAHMFSLRLRLVSRSLRCVQIHGSEVESVSVVDTPRLERLVLTLNLARGGPSATKIKIGNARCSMTSSLGRSLSSFSMMKGEASLP
ncbi:hypothetical protein ACP4OV_029146 [Aristida adscensionis]